MKRALSLTLVAAAAIILFGRATCGRPRPAGVRPVEAMTIADNVYYHNVGITYANGRYYTINGGNEGWSTLNVYDRDGRLLDSFSPGIDGRSIFYHPDDDVLYVKPYGEDLYYVDPEVGTAEVDFEYLFASENSSVAFSPDGSYMYELDDGTVYVYDMLFGEPEDEFELAVTSGEHGYMYTLAASDRHLFTWDVDQSVYVHTLDGEFVTKFTLPLNGFGFSLSWANGMLWIAEDADAADEGGDGYWHGYRLEGLE